MNRIMVSALAALALPISSLPLVSLPALGADLAVKAPVSKAAPVSPVTNWNGWYAGGHAGYLWGKTTVWEDGILEEEDAKTNGFVGGLLAGVNWQSSAWVFSLEGDFGWTNAHGNGVAAPVVVNHYDFHWTSHIRGRVGYAFDNVLIFLAGGVALADFDFSQTGISMVCGGTYTGWTIGGGFDVAVSRNWIARLEYLHDDFGSKNYVMNTEPYKVKITGDTVRGAVMYKF